jgi:hypothetical protein
MPAAGVCLLFILQGNIRGFVPHNTVSRRMHAPATKRCAGIAVSRDEKKSQLFALAFCISFAFACACVSPASRPFPANQAIFMTTSHLLDRI